MKITKSTKEQDVLRLGAECRKCGNCCSYGSGFVLEHEIPRIAAFLKIPKEKFMREFLEETEIFNTKLFKIRSMKKQGSPYGPCMFLDNSLCRIQPVKPLHCRVGNCSKHGEDLHVWFLTNYCLNIYDPESVRQYSSYIKTGGKVLEGAELETLFPDRHQLDRILSYKRLK